MKPCATKQWNRKVPGSAGRRVGAERTPKVKVATLRRNWTLQHRLRLDARVFRIVSVRAHDRSGRFLDIHAEERVD